MNLYSIGHSNVSFEALLALLRRHQIEVLVDVRSQPYSRYNPHFGRERLKQALEENQLHYLFLGDRIGGKPTAPGSLAPDGHVDYEKLAASKPYLEGIEQLVRLGETRKVCFMCAEADYRRCHRYHLITRTLVERDLEVKHILPSGELATSDSSDFESEQLGLFD
ncbi:MAG TPA: DUF488 domain-containing protein [Blastocatellia bacterium]|nr:DUF488 domain-containing protein [Blastocatellia bacterium]